MSESPPSLGFAAIGFAATGFVAVGFVAVGFGATGFGAVGFVAVGFGATGFGATGFGAGGTAATTGARAGVGSAVIPRRAGTPGARRTITRYTVDGPPPRSADGARTPRCPVSAFMRVTAGAGPNQSASSSG